MRSPVLSNHQLLAVNLDLDWRLNILSVYRHSHTDLCGCGKVLGLGRRYGGMGLTMFLFALTSLFVLLSISRTVCYAAGQDI